MKVKLLNAEAIKEGVKLAAYAGSVCYADEPNINMTDGKIDSMLRHIVESQHHSVIEHMLFVVEVIDISRSCLAQLTRHRIAGFSVRSQRYIEEGKGRYILPPSLHNRGDIKILLKRIDSMYNHLIEEGVAKEDARAILPNATATRLVMSMNARSLLHFFEERMCRHAQEEIRVLALEIFKLVYPLAPAIFDYAGARCQTVGCKEGNRSCGKPYSPKEWLEL